MKLTSAMLGITAALFFWMTAAFLRPVPSDTYEHYAVEVTPTLESTAQIDTAVEEQMD